MNRRNFFASLFAPIAAKFARWWPKREPEVEILATVQSGGGITTVLGKPYVQECAGCLVQLGRLKIDNQSGQPMTVKHMCGGRYWPIHRSADNEIVGMKWHSDDAIAGLYSRKKMMPFPLRTPVE